MNQRGALFAPAFCQKGALFGLDARLVIAIFAMTTLVAGVNVYYKRAQAEQTALLKRIELLDTELRNLQTDLGVFLAFATFEDIEPAQHLSALWENTVLLPRFHNSWNGPYLFEEQFTDREWALHYASEHIEDECTLYNACYTWIVAHNVSKAELGALNQWRGLTPDSTTGDHVLKIVPVSEKYKIYYRSAQR